MTQLKIDHVTKSIDGRNILRIDNLIFKNNGIYGLVGLMVQVKPHYSSVFVAY
ncbi:hypothetical protein [Secundilactobacillus kimchicus]|uniref:hypothetical protein n=1 Tax=Secundilactobacillus kimchicus TaxID=528209 RepID=UPI000A9305FB|nr:hypothetical protein [Secundilactobacillus kimchicus]